jgi:membrane fusion protein (multidrug efflux system)
VSETNGKQDDHPNQKERQPGVVGRGGAAARNGRKKIVRWGAAALVIVTLLVFAVVRYIHARSHESTDDAFIDGDIVPVSPRVAGHVAKVYAGDNQWVEAGALLVELDPRDFQTRLDAATAVFKAARAADQARNVAVELTRITSTAERDEARDGVTAAEAAVQEAEARLALAKAALHQVGAEADAARVRHRRDAVDLERYRQMARTQTVSPQDLDHVLAAEQIAAADLTAARRKVETQQAKVREAEAALQSARAQLRQARARLAAAQAAPQRIQQSRSQANVSSADIDKAEAQLAQARLELSYTKIVAPTGGFVTKKRIEPGQFAQAGQSILAIVPREVWITANFKETQLTLMRPGQPVEITVDAYPDQILHGHVDSIQRGTGARFSLLPAENATGNYVKVVQRMPVKIVFDRPEETARILLAPGMSVVPEVNVGAEGRPTTARNDNPKDDRPASAL